MKAGIEMLILSIWLCISNTIGLLLYSFIWRYLNKKPEGQKTSFDLVVKDNIIINLGLPMIKVFAISSATLNQIPEDMKPAILILSYLIFQIFCASNLVTLFTKAMFIEYPMKLLEFSDVEIRIGSWLLRGLLIVCSISIDKWGPLKIPLAQFFLQPIEDSKENLESNEMNDQEW